MEKNDLVTIDIDSLSNDGNGVGRYNGIAIFVPASVPGDCVEARLVKLAKSYAFGRLERMISPSPARIDNDCPAFPRCGGCAFRQLDYAAELAAKRDFVAAALRRIGGLELPVLETVSAGPQTHYRNKAQFPVCQADGRLAIGLYAGRSHRVVPCDHCLLQSELVNRIAVAACNALSALGLPAYDEATGRGVVRHLFLRQSALDGSVMLCPVINADGFAGEQEFVADMTRQFPLLTTIMLNMNRQRTNVILGERCRTLTGSGFLDDQLCGVPVRLSPFSFFQVNHAAATTLYNIAARLADPVPRDTLLDLYCGAGTIGLSMAPRCGQLLGVEVIPQAVEDARHNARAMGIAHAEFLLADAGNAVAQLARRGQRVDIAITDPPRRGCDAQTLSALLTLSPRRIIMISCDPATLARDLKILCAAGYRAESAIPVDMFPRTRHVETIVLLQRQDA